MTQAEIGGYALLGGYGVMLLLAIKVFGPKRVFRVVFGLVFLAVWVALGTLGGISGHRS